MIAIQPTSFIESLVKNSLQLNRRHLQVLQVNLGYICNLACHHCHVEAGPKRKEIMTEEVIDRLISLLNSSTHINTLDLTGGAPEMNPFFRKIVLAARELNLKIIDRCNLTIFFEDGYSDLPNFLKENKVEIIASLPCYSKENVEKQRGLGVFNKSIEALKILNKLGYGNQENLKLDLVYNPGGASLPPSQQKLEQDYKRELKDLFGIEFNQLFTITNMPIKRFLKTLEKLGKYEQYMELLVNHFNPTAAEGVMCRDLISINWKGDIYDCDFNQILELPIPGLKKTIWDIQSFEELETNPIVFENHCYGCTAGSGSSCTGAIQFN